jgi:hypothetical protein
MIKEIKKTGSLNQDDD